jgi:predicted nucleic acid-binding protein
LHLSSVFRPLLGVHSSIGLSSDALRIQQRYRISWYDSLIIAAANELKCVVLYTEDLQDGAKFDGVQVKNPF